MQIFIKIGPAVWPVRVIHTHIQTNIQAKIGIKPTFLKKFFSGSGGYGGSWGDSLWVAVIDYKKTFFLIKTSEMQK